MPSLSRRGLLTAGLAGAGGVFAVAPGRLGTPAAAAVGHDGPLVALRTPIRVFDSRFDNTLGRKKLVTGQSVAATLSPAFGDIESGYASLVFVNCTITQTEGWGYLVIRGSDLTGDLPLPNTSNINWTTSNQTLANLVLTTVGGENALEVHCAGGGSTHVIIDVQGYVPYLL